MSDGNPKNTRLFGIAWANSPEINQLGGDLRECRFTGRKGRGDGQDRPGHGGVIEPTAEANRGN
jgi:hypothetical protein